MRNGQCVMRYLHFFLETKSIFWPYFHASRLIWWCDRISSRNHLPVMHYKGKFGNEMQGALCVTFHPYNLVQYILFCAAMTSDFRPKANVHLELKGPCEAQQAHLFLQIQFNIHSALSKIHSATNPLNS
jgi:hypothetical protein